MIYLQYNLDFDLINQYHKIYFLKIKIIFIPYLSLNPKILLSRSKINLIIFNSY